MLLLPCKPASQAAPPSLADTQDSGSRQPPWASQGPCSKDTKSAVRAPPPPQCAHMDSCTHADTPGCICSTHTDVFTFIPRHTHTRTHTPGTRCAMGYTHTHCTTPFPFWSAQCGSHLTPELDATGQRRGYASCYSDEAEGRPMAGGSKAADEVGVSRHPESLGFCQKSRGVRSPKSQSKRSLMPSPSSRPK